MTATVLVVDDLLRLYREDPEEAHGIEDGLLESYVRRMATLGDPDAQALIPLLDTKRTRWYA